MVHRKRFLPLALLLLVPAVVGAGSLVMRRGSGSIQRIALTLPPSAAQTGFRNMDPEEALALRTIQENGRQRVADLTANASNLSSSERDALERKVVQVKIDAELEFLRTCLRFSQARGNPAEIAEAEQALKAFNESLRAPSIGSDSPPQEKDFSGGRP